MSTQLQRGQAFPDLALPDHRGQRLRLSQLTAAGEFSRRLGFTAGRPLLVVFYRGFFCPRDRLQLQQLSAFYPEIVLSYASLVAISVDPPPVAAAYRAGLGATFPFLSDQDRVAVTQLGIVDNTDGEYPNVAIPHTFCLAPDLTIHTVYNGWWFVGRPTVEELRHDLRALMEGRADYPHAAWDTPAVKTETIPQERSQFPPSSLRGGYFYCSFGCCAKKKERACTPQYYLLPSGSAKRVCASHGETSIP